jgi:predicted RNase H-like HicB family nuclease
MKQKQQYTAVIKQSGPWWIGWIEEVPGVNCQEASKEELLESLRVTLQEALELNRREALQAAGEDFDKNLRDTVRFSRAPFNSIMGEAVPNIDGGNDEYSRSDDEGRTPRDDRGDH